MSAPLAPSLSCVAFDAGAEPDRLRLGGKGAGLVRMLSLGLPVPPGFVVPTEVGKAFLTTGGALPEGVLDDIGAHLDRLEASLDRRLGDPAAPLFVSVRSGAPVSMPGMMDTILNVGMNDAVADALAQATGDPGFAWSSYERLLHTFATTVREIPVADVEDALFDAEPEGDDAGATARGCVRVLLDLLARDGDPFPADPRAQVAECVAAVFRSWRSPRAVAYRAHEGIDEALGTACVVQAMVFGNRGDTSGSGVAFSRDPSSGEPGVYGDVLMDAQGEDVVAGTADPDPIDTLDRVLPDAMATLRDVLGTLEREARDLVECEFTIEEGRFWILQYRPAKRSGRAAVRVAVDLVDEGVLSEDEAAALVSDAQIDSARAPRFARAADDGEVVARGTAASPGAATGVAVLDATRAATRKDAGEDVVLVRPTTSPADIHGFIASVAVVTGRGGRTSHAAVVARGMDRPAVCGIGSLTLGTAEDGTPTATVDGVTIREGDLLAVDGDRGIVSRVAPPLEDAASDARLGRLLEWRS